MTIVAAEIRGLLSGARMVVGIVKKVGSSAALQARFDESVLAVHRDAAQVTYAVCRALVAHALGRDPSDGEVDEVLSTAVSDPAFPNRAYRLLGELRKSASQRRRFFLASILFGLPFSRLPDDERDRVDMAVERMMPADVELLGQIVERDRMGRRSPEHEPYFFKTNRVVALIRGVEVRVVAADDWGDASESRDDVYADPRFLVDHAAFGLLLSLGLVDVGESKASKEEWEIHRLVITPLGRLVIRAIEEVRPGFDAGANTASWKPPAGVAEGYK